MLKQNTAIPLVITTSCVLTFIWGLSYIAVMSQAPSGELEIRFRYLEKYYNKGDNDTTVHFNVKAGITSNNISIMTRDVHVKSVLFRISAITPITILASDNTGFQWDHTVTILDLIDEHWIDLYINYFLGDKYTIEICFTWTRDTDKS